MELKNRSQHGAILPRYLLILVVACGVLYLAISSPSTISGQKDRTFHPHCRQGRMVITRSPDRVLVQRLIVLLPGDQVCGAEQTDRIFHDLIRTYTGKTETRNLEITLYEASPPKSPAEYELDREQVYIIFVYQRF